MKESEQLKKQAEQTENDFRAFGLYTKSIRAERSESFQDKWLPLLRDKTDVIQRDNGAYSFDSEYGVIDFYPKANKILFRKSNKWFKPGLAYIIKNIINKS